MGMLLEEGLVVGVDGEVAQVRVARGSSCGGCSEKGACSPLDPAGQEIVIHVENRLDVHPGQRVVVGVEENMVLRGAMWIYALPLVTFFSGYWLGGRLAPAGGGESNSAIVGALIGLVVGIVAVYWRFSHASTAAAYRPRLVKAL